MNRLCLAALIGLSALTTFAEDTLRIGVIAELTGDKPAIGASCKNASEMAVKEINDAGGLDVGGHKVKLELFIEDNASRSDQSAAAAQKLITQQEVLAIIGPNASSCAIPAAEIAEASETVLITPWSTNPKTTRDSTSNRPKTFVFRACFIDPFQGGVLARFAQEKLKATNAAVLYDVASDYNKGIAEVFKDKFTQLGGKVVAFETYTTSDRDFSAQLTKIKAAKPDVIFLPNYYSEVPLQIQQARRLGIQTPILGSDSWGNAELIALGGKEVEGCYFSAHYAADSASKEAAAFIKKYNEVYGALPDDVAALTYDAFGILFTAIRSAGKPDRLAIRNALAVLPEFPGVTGQMTFDGQSGDPVKSAVILQIKDGKFVYFADAKP